MSAAEAIEIDDEYEHWPEQFSQQPIRPPAAVYGFDSHNGLRGHVYVPPGQKASAGEPANVSQSAPDQLPAWTPFYVPNPGVQYANAQPGAMAPYPSAGAYFTVAIPVSPIYAALANCSAVTPQTVALQPDMPVPQKLAPVAYLGRTREEVDADNMVIAAREGANDRRSVVPIDVADDQLMWVVELDGSHTLRTFSTIKDFQGEWLKDPRFESSYYFLRKADQPAEAEAE